MQSLSALFWRNIAKSDGNDCWPWTGSTNGAGYGTYQVSGERLYAHRQAYIEARGDIPEGLVVRHDCDNPICCNPAHLRTGTKKENTQDAVARGRFSGRRAVRGADHGMAVIDEACVREMRARFNADRRGDTVHAAEAFNISHSQAHRILRGQSWKHL